MTSDEFKAGRQELGYTQIQTAKIMGVKQPEVSHWERGTRSIPVYAADRLNRILARSRAVQVLDSLPPGESPSCKELETRVFADMREFWAHTETCEVCFAIWLDCLLKQAVILKTDPVVDTAAV